MRKKRKTRGGKWTWPFWQVIVFSRLWIKLKPEKIVLFGSVGRGTMRPDSDIDLMVIKGGRFNLMTVSPKRSIDICPAKQRSMSWSLLLRKLTVIAMRLVW